MNFAVKSAYRKTDLGQSRIDVVLIVLIIFLAGLGTLMVFSSTVYFAQKHFNDSWQFFYRHIIHLILSFGLFGLGYISKPDKVFRLRWVFLLMSLLALVLVFLPGLSPKINGAHRWIRVFGFMLQTSELAKLGLIVFTAAYAAKPVTSRTSPSNMTWYLPLMLLMIFDGLLLLQPDLGSAVVLSLVILQCLFLAGMPLRLCFQILLGFLVVVAALVVSAPYRLLRIVAFIDPWKHALGSGYQLTQSLMAVGRGGLMGVGIGNGLQKHFYLPEAHTDFIFAVMCEELGAFFAMVVILVYLLLSWRLLFWSWRFAKQGAKFSAYYTAALGLWLGNQSMISVAVNLGLLPTKGLVLPFLSYGGSYLLAFGWALGFACSMIHQFAQVGKKRGGLI